MRPNFPLCKRTAPQSRGRLGLLPPAASGRNELRPSLFSAIGDIAYRRKDDEVIICPIAALKP